MKKIEIIFKDLKFNSIKKCAEYFNVKYSTFYKYYSLTKPIEWIIASFSHSIVYYDHKGNSFDSIDSMLKAYNIPKKTYISRKRQKWTLEKILTTQIKEFEYKGVKYHSLTDFCRKNKISTKYISILRKSLKDD